MGSTRCFRDWSRPKKGLSAEAASYVSAAPSRRHGNGILTFAVVSRSLADDSENFRDYERDAIPKSAFFEDSQIT